MPMTDVGEENRAFHFDNPDTREPDPRRRGSARERPLALGQARSALRHSNEFHRFGWVVEVGPCDPAGAPVQRTAPGRVAQETGKIVLNAVLFSMIGGVLLIHYNGMIASRLAGPAAEPAPRADPLPGMAPPQMLIGGYGRVGHAIAVLLESSGVDFLALDTDPTRVLQGQADGHAVLYGDIADPELLTAVRAERAHLAIVTVDNHVVALRAVAALSQHCPQVPVIARARDLQASSALVRAGAMQAYPEAIESSLRLGATALRVLRVPTADIDRMLQDIRDRDYEPVAEAPRTSVPHDDCPADPRRHRPVRAGGVPLRNRIDHPASNILLPLSGNDIVLLVGWGWRGTAARGAADVARSVAGALWPWSMRLALPVVIGLVMSRGLGWIRAMPGRSPL